MRHPTKLKKTIIKIQTEDFTSGPVVKTLPSKAGDTGSIPSQGTKIPHAAGQLSPSAATAEPTSSRVCALKLENLPPARKTQHSCPPNKENIQEVSVLLPARNTEHLPEGHGE